MSPQPQPATPCTIHNLPWSPRQIFIDDPDDAGRITYTGNWTTRDDNIWLDFEHEDGHTKVLSSQASGLGFGFQGTAVSLLGNISSTSNKPFSTSSLNVDCTIDGKSFSILPSNSSNFLCGADGLEDGEHKLSYSISDPSNSSGLKVTVNSVQYTPSSSSSSSSSSSGSSQASFNTSDTSIIDICDPSIQYETDLSNWEAYDLPPEGENGSGLWNEKSTVGYKTKYRGIKTNVNGTRLSYTFKGGNYFGIYGIIPPKNSSSSSSSTSSSSFGIGRPPAQILAQTWSNGKLTGGGGVTLSTNETKTTFYGLILGESGPTDPDTEQTITITYLGGPDQEPLVLSYLTVPSEPLDKPKTKVGPIAGGIVGGVVGVVLLCVLGWYVHKKWKSQRKGPKAWDPVSWKDIELKTKGSH